MSLEQRLAREMNNDLLLEAMCIFYSRYQKMGTNSDYKKHHELRDEAKRRLSLIKTIDIGWPV